MRRVVVAGGTGFFGRTVLKLLAQRGIEALAAARRSGADVQMDVENGDSVRRVLQPGDVVIDTAGPFQERSTTLIEAALEIGCDYLDISDSLAYARRVVALTEKITAAGIRVFSSCSTVSAISAWLVRRSGIVDPVRVSGFLAPAARYSASAGTAQSLLRSIGRDVQVWRGGAWTTRRGWIDSRRLSLSPPIGTVRGHLFETADSFWLPRIWPSLQTVDYFVDTRVTGLNALFSLAARQPLVRWVLQRLRSPGHQLARLLGSKASCVAVEVEAHDGVLVQQALYCPDSGYRLAALPAVLAAQSLIEGRLLAPGLVAWDRQVDDQEMHAALKWLGVTLIASSASDGDRA